MLLHSCREGCLKTTCVEILGKFAASWYSKVVDRIDRIDRIAKLGFSLKLRSQHERRDALPSRLFVLVVVLEKNRHLISVIHILRFKLQVTVFKHETDKREGMKKRKRRGKGAFAFTLVARSTIPF